MRGWDAPGVRTCLRGVQGHVLARAHGAQRGRGPHPGAFREGTAVSCQVDGTNLDESLAGRRPGSAAVLPREPRRSAGPCATHARLKGFLARFREVSTRRLGHYLDWFLWDEQTRRPGADRADTLSG